MSDMSDVSDTMSFDMDPSDLHTPGYEQAAASPADTDASSQPTKKKRKAWGQPIPDFKEVIGPRKRAKTTEEKEQRKNERILRNRKAADKSRQRQKAAVADLEEKQSRMEQENVALRHALSQYQAQFGILPHVPFPIFDANQTFQSPRESYLDTEKDTKRHLSTAPYDTPHTPALSYDSPLVAPKQESPALAPTLFPSHQELHDLSTYTDLDSLGNFSETGMTQYPAAILCDPQCQPLSAKFQAQIPSNMSVAFIQLMMVTTTLTTFSLSTLLPLMEIFQTLIRTLSTPLMDTQAFLNNSLNFSLIHTLISTPSTPTNPKGVFRMKLLSRLLACSPRMARLLLAATQQALQRVVDEDKFSEDPRARWMWASLITMKWAIIRLEREHMRVRLGGDFNGPETGLALSGENEIDGMYYQMAGVDYQAVERSSGRYKAFREEGDGMGIHLLVDDALAQVSEVH